MKPFCGRLILLDIEGTVSPLAYVHEVLFPHARARVEGFLEECWQAKEVTAALAQMATDAGRPSSTEQSPTDERPRIVAEVHALMDADAKTTGLKQLQGLIWQRGFESGALRTVVFPDVPPALRRLSGAGIQLRIYSSGSIHAQRLFFTYTEAGDLTPLLSGYYDTTTGPKRAAGSYQAIAAAAEFTPGDILFLSDVVEELNAAREAGMQTGLAIRPGNREAAPGAHPTFTSLEEITL